MTEDNSPLTEAHTTAWARLVRESQRVMQRVEVALKEAGLPPLFWYDLLLELKRAEPQGLRPYELQSAMLIPQYNISRLIDRVTKAGHAARFRCDDDGRGQIIRITTSGKALQKRMWPVYRGVLEREFASKLDEGKAKRLAELLR